MIHGYAHDQLQCIIVKFEADFTRKEAWLYFPEGDCCDQDGCVAVVTALMPEAEMIFTLSGNAADTGYFKRGSDWHPVRL